MATIRFKLLSPPPVPIRKAIPLRTAISITILLEDKRSLFYRQRSFTFTPAFLRILAYPQQRRLYLCLAASVLLHALLLGGFNLGVWFIPKPTKVQPPQLQAHLLPPAAADVLKNTLNNDREEVLAMRPPPAARPAKLARLQSHRDSAERKLAEHLYYPPEAIARGLQGEVRLLLTLDAQGMTIDVRIASSSGHDLLDQAAIAAAHAMGRLPDTGTHELILPVMFRLQ